MWLVVVSCPFLDDILKFLRRANQPRIIISNHQPAHHASPATSKRPALVPYADPNEHSLSNDACLLDCRGASELDSRREKRETIKPHSGNKAHTATSNEPVKQTSHGASGQSGSVMLNSAPTTTALPYFTLLTDWPPWGPAHQKICSNVGRRKGGRGE